ncbi:MAG: tetratricopeptide repeat protein [Pseudobdellovibrionaceae bacterium]|nr:MAG: tetratricopeptide repeat protein [Pseudobdellovibrionaceae bacterium]
MQKWIQILILTISCGVAQLAVAQFEDSSGKLVENTEANVDTVTRENRDALEKAFNGSDEQAFLDAVAVVLGKDAKNAEGLNALAAWYIKNKKSGLAEVILNRALESHPEDPALHNNLGVVYQMQGKFFEAIASFRKAVSFKTDHIAAGINLGSVYLAYGDFEKAVEALRPGYLSLGSDLGRGKTPAVEVANNYAVAMFEKGDGAEATKIFQKIDESEVRNEVVLLNYAILLANTESDKKNALRVISRLRFLTEDPGVRKRLDQIEQQMDSK